MTRIWDEDDVRVRAPKGKSRPRSTHRPTYSEAVSGHVVAVDRGRFTLVLDLSGVRIFAVKARELGRKSVVVGDVIWVIGDISGGPDRLGRIVRIEPRVTVLRRSADDGDPVERVIVANASQLAIVTSLANPEPSPGFIDRCLVAAFDAGLKPLLVLTKADLVAAESLSDLYGALKLSIVTCGFVDAAPDPETVSRLRSELADRATVLIGHSGVGKSTLMNALVPGAQRETGIVNGVTGRGRHTSTAAVAVPLTDGGWLIDTPGVRSFGLAHVQPQRVLGAFPEFAGALENCPRGCPHLSDSRDCALDGYVSSLGTDLPSGIPATGSTTQAEARMNSLRRLLAVRPAAPGE